MGSLILVLLGMVRVSEQFPTPQLSAGQMDPSSVALLFGFSNFEVLAACV
jgi:hypothetical protein